MFLNYYCKEHHYNNSMNTKLPEQDKVTFNLFDEVKIKPGVYSEHVISDAAIEHNFFVIKRYVVELGEEEVPFVDILRHPEREEHADLKKDFKDLRGIMAMPRWTKPFILSFPADSIQHATRD